MEEALLTFVIPVRHQENAKDWGLLKRRLGETITSISGQSSDLWRCIIVANEGADLPPLPSNFSAARVTLPPNPMHERAGADLHAFYKSVRLDKGSRVLAGVRASKSKYVMVVDDDDFIDRNLVKFVSDNQDKNGWFFKSGFVWEDGGKHVYRHPRFNHFCGTSHIVKRSLLNVPEQGDVDIDYVKRMLGSHMTIERELAENGTPLEPLPFEGAVYRIGHAGAHSRSQTLAKTFLLRRSTLLRPWRVIGALTRIRRLDRPMARRFFGVQ